MVIGTGFEPHARFGVERRFALLLAITAAALPAPGWADERVIRGGAYDIRAVTYMPHLEQMRHIETRQQRCVTGDTPTAVFPVLSQPALRGCELTDARKEDSRLWYTLRCSSDLVATGRARVDANRAHIAGTLWIKMGGKNMTFSQRVNAVWQAPCDDSAAFREPLAPRPGIVPQTDWRWRYPDTGWSTMTERCRVTPGAWPASAHCGSTKQGMPG